MLGRETEYTVLTPRTLPILTVEAEAGSLFLQRQDVTNGSLLEKLKEKARRAEYELGLSDSRDAQCRMQVADMAETTRHAVLLIRLHEKLPSLLFCSSPNQPFNIVGGCRDRL